MSWDGSPSLGSGVDAFLSSLSAHGQPQGHRAFPPNVDRATLRFQGAETIKQWFSRCVAAFMPEGLERWQLEENLAAFAFVSWRAGNELDHVTINLLKTECSLQDYHQLTEEDLQDDEWRSISRPQYMRLDLDYGTLGPIGTHPLPHVHFSPDDPPRFALDASRSTNVVVDFIDFVYRHDFSRRWLDWARQTWNRHYRERSGDPERNPFDRIIASYNEGQMAVIRSLADDIAALTSVLHDARGRMYDLRMNERDRRLMSFPDLTWGEPTGSS